MDKILEWISKVPYASHHKRISEKRLEGTGEWLFIKSEYHQWQNSSASKLLLLRGTRKFSCLYCLDARLTKSPLNSRSWKNLHCVINITP